MHLLLSMRLNPTCRCAVKTRAYSITGLNYMYSRGLDMRIIYGKSVSMYITCTKMI